MTSVDPHKTVLLVIDMQKGFVDEDSPLCVRMAAATIGSIARDVLLARSLEMPVYWILRSHAADGSDMEKFRQKALASVDCLDLFAPGSTGIRIADGLETASDSIVYKKRFSAFFGTDLDGRLKSAGINTVLVAGTQTPNCVRATAVDAISLGYRCIVLAEDTSSQTAEIQEANLNDMANMGMEIIRNLEEII